MNVALVHSSQQGIGAEDGEGQAPPPIVRKRDGSVDTFDSERIRVAIEKAYRADLGIEGDAPLPAQTETAVSGIADAVIGWCATLDEVQVERIQDEVEKALMAIGAHGVARRYILYREAHAEMRRAKIVHYTRIDGTVAPIDHDVIRGLLSAACAGLDDVVPEQIFAEAISGFYDGMAEKELAQSLVLTTRSRIEEEPNYAYVAARLLLTTIYTEATGTTATILDADAVYRTYFKEYVTVGVAAELLDPALLSYDLDRLVAAIRPERDLLFVYMGLQTLYDRYLVQVRGRRIELPQLFWMRVAMGLALGETDREARAIEFYELISRFAFTPSSPTLFNAGTCHPQLSSCFLTTVPDDLGMIFKGIRDNALLSKWSGGLGNDWTPVRALGSHIKGTNGKSQGIVPFLKVANDAAIAVNQGGKRKGAVCAYLETWHLDIEEFLELRRNTGDDRRRTHDMNTANWVPDLFLKRVAEGGQWTLFSPNEVPDLHDLYGAAFEARYTVYEAMAQRGELSQCKTISAPELWRKMLTMLFETGHPWITFKDPSNVRSPQDHVGVVHNSNLCTEILLNTNADETAVCNLGSVNLPLHIKDGALDLDAIETTVRTGLRMLDNVINLNFYPTDEARVSNLRHRPVGLGIMGFQDSLYALGIAYASDAAITFADQSMEAISYHAILASSDLARERGTYATYKGSKWDRGLMPIDTMDLLARERGMEIPVDRSVTLDWNHVRAAVRVHGMRNSNVMAIAPTATISIIVGSSQSIEPTYKNLYAKANMSGDFTQVNTFLIADLKKLGLWDAEMLDDLKYFDGSLSEIERIPVDVRDRYRTAFEIGPEWLIEAAARRQKWIDMGQSLNLYMAAPSGKKLHEMYFLAWHKGLKTTYYLRTLAATQVEKSTIDINRRAIQPRWMKSKSASANITVDRQKETPDA